MTLLITAANKLAVHQSSDYRLTDWSGRVIETANGTKQLSVSAEYWAGQIAFTGIANDGHGYRTLDWLQAVAGSVDLKAGPEVFVQSLVTRGTEELRRLKADAERRRLTVLVTVCDGSRCRLFLVSNFEAPKQNWRRQALDALEHFEIDLAKAVVQVNGCRGAVRKWDVKCLQRMLGDNREPREIRDRMAVANRDAAQQPSFRNLISEGCWACSLFADGKEHGFNYGEVAGVPADFMHGLDLSEQVKRVLRLAPGKQILRQTAVVRWSKGVPLPPPTGDPREVRFATRTSSLSIGHGERLPRITFDGREGVALTRKNEQVTVALGSLTLEIDPTADDELVLEMQEFPNMPTVDGAQPRSWNYSFDLHGGPGCYTLQFRTASVALRNSESTRLPVLGANEELVLAAPIKSMLLYATPQAPRVSQDVVASLLIRDYPELLAKAQKD